MPVGGRMAAAANSSEVKTRFSTTPADSTVRKTVITPTSGTRVRVISAQLVNNSATETLMYLYFGTTAPADADATTFITARLMASAANTITANAFQQWPDGGGPVGAIDQVVSIITSADIAGNGRSIITYREE